MNRSTFQLAPANATVQIGSDVFHVWLPESLLPCRHDASDVTVRVEEHPTTFFVTCACGHALTSEEIMDRFPTNGDFLRALARSGYDVSSSR